MTKDQQRELVGAMTTLAEQVQKQEGFMDDEELKATYVIVHSALASLMFNETISLAEACAEWCVKTGHQVAENN